MIASAEPVTGTDAHLEMDTSAAPAMDPELVRILESFDELKLPPLSAEVTLYLESAPGFVQASGKLARLEKDQSWGGEEGRGNLLDRIQGQLKRGSPWLKTSAERKKSKRDLPSHLQILGDRLAQGNASPDQSPSSSPGSSSGSSTPPGALSPERSPSTETPTSVLPRPDDLITELQNDSLSLNPPEVDPSTPNDSVPAEHSHNSGVNAPPPNPGFDTAPKAQDDLSLPTHLRCQTSPRPGQHSLPSSPFRSLTPTRSPLGLLSRTSRSFPSSPDSAHSDPESAHMEQQEMERNSARLERSFSEPRAIPHRRRSSGSSGLRRALFSVAHSLKSSLGGHVAKPQPMDAAAVARHLLTPPRKLAPAVARSGPLAAPIRRRSFSKSQPLQPTNSSPHFGSRSLESDSRFNSLSLEKGSGSPVYEQLTMASILEEQLRERQAKAHGVRQGVETEGPSEMETDDEGYFAPTSWKSLSKPGAGVVRGASFDAAPFGREDEWMECIDKQVVTTPFWREGQEKDEVVVEKRVTEVITLPVDADESTVLGATGSVLSGGGMLSVEEQSVIRGVAMLVGDLDPISETVVTSEVAPPQESATELGTVCDAFEVREGAGEETQAPPCRDVRMDLAPSVASPPLPSENQTQLCSNGDEAAQNEQMVDASTMYGVLSDDVLGAETFALALCAPLFDATPSFPGAPGADVTYLERKEEPVLLIPSPVDAATNPRPALSPILSSPQALQTEPISPKTSSPKPDSRDESLALNLKTLNLGALPGVEAARLEESQTRGSEMSKESKNASFPRVLGWHVPQNPEEYEARQLEEALPSIYKGGHFIHRSRSRARAPTQGEVSQRTPDDVSQRDLVDTSRRGQSDDKQFKLQWRRERSPQLEKSERNRIDEEEYQKALFGTVES